MKYVKVNGHLFPVNGEGIATMIAEGIFPHIGENGNWWFDDVDTGVPTRGPQGEQGIQGIQGIQGVPGNDGHTPVITIGDNGNWFIDNVDTNKSAIGPQGNTGNGISSITKTGTSELEDTYTITFTNGSTTTFTVTNGKDGEQGIQGEQGLQGRQGEQGPQGLPGQDGHTLSDNEIHAMGYLKLSDLPVWDGGYSDVN